MANDKTITIFGEVLFDCFPDGAKVLGGAPFNICWHLQALGDTPVFISRVGEDPLGQKILQHAENWGLATDNIQMDTQHPTGKVQITLADNEPQYDITPNSAYDFIENSQTRLDNASGILYHGSLALRSDFAKEQFTHLKASGDWSIFLDVNLRAPWWQKETLFDWINDAKWVKLNIDELHQLGFKDADLQCSMQQFKDQFGCEQLILTQGAQGSSVLSDNGFFQQTPPKIEHFIDTVGAGDAFTSVYIHGLLHQWSVEKTLQEAQAFASKVIGLRGALSTDPAFYQHAFAEVNK